MSVPKKKVIVSKKLSDEDKLNAARWCAFIRASAKPVQELSDEWYNFFDKQADVSTSTGENLVRLVDLAINNGKLLEGEVNEY